MDVPAMIPAEGHTPLEAERLQIERARRDPQAFAALYRRHRLAISRYLFRRTGDVHATEDLVSEVFLSALRALPRYRYRGMPMRYWLYRIASNAANRWSRKQGRRWASLPPEGPPAPSEDLGNGAGELAQWALLQLPPKHQTAVALHYLEGLSVEEVARVVGCRTGTIKSRLSRARETLRERLDRRSRP